MHSTKTLSLGHHLQFSIRKFLTEKLLSGMIKKNLLFSREYHWANYATGLGASLHELGHTFDLAHTPSGIMARGFDDLHKVFIVQRSERTNESVDSSNHSNGSVMSLSSNSETENEPSSLVHHQAQRYKDVCYGSPLRKVSEPVGDKTDNLGFRPGLTQTGLYSHRRWLEA